MENQRLQRRKFENRSRRPRIHLDHRSVSSFRCPNSLSHAEKKDNEWPDIKPTACVVNVPSPSNAQNSPPAFKVLRNKCYSPVDKLIYYCTITPKTSTIPPNLVGKISTWDDDWLLNITDNTADELGHLKTKGFSECNEVPKVQPVVPKIPMPPPLPPPPISGQSGGQRQSPSQFSPAAGAGTRQQTKREIRTISDLWRKVDKRSSRSVRSLFSPRVSSQNLAKSITV